MKLFGIEKVEEKYGVRAEIYLSGPEYVVLLEATEESRLRELLESLASTSDKIHSLRVKLVFYDEEDLRRWIRKTTST